MATKETLDAMREKAAKLQAKIDAAEAKEKARERTADTREKVLIGSAHKARMKKQPEAKTEIAALLKEEITSPKDRAFLKGRGWPL